MDAAGRVHLLAGASDGIVRVRDVPWLDAHRLQREIDAGRWEVVRRSITIVGAPMNERSTWRLALSSASPRAALDGVTALRCAGLSGFEDTIHVSVPRGARVERSAAVRIHHLRDFDEDDVQAVDLRRVRPALAALRAATWAVTERAAYTVLAMAVQQRIVGAAELDASLGRLPQHRRRSKAIAGAVVEIGGGAEALGELDFAQLCRRHGLPRPSRQDRLQRPSGVFYTDARFAAYGVVVEIDGIQHLTVAQARQDHRKHNELQLSGDVVLRVLGAELRCDPEPFMRQLQRALASRGWAG